MVRAQVPREAVDHIYGNLSEEYIQKQWYEGVLDLSIIYVDIAITLTVQIPAKLGYKR